MKKSALLVIFGLAAFVLLAPGVNAQSEKASPTAPSKQDQTIKELLSEVHQLRVAMQHMSVNAYRGQIMVERLRSQQEQVSRLARDLNAVRNDIAEVKTAQASMKEMLDDAEKKTDDGVMSSTELKGLRVHASGLKQREQNLSEREARLSLELDQERLNLADLNKRLDALEREMVITGLGDDVKRNPKR